MALKLKKLFRDTALITTLVGGFFLLFSLQALLSDLPITGDVIQVGKQTDSVIIKPPPDDLSPHVEQPAPDPQTQCWKERGLRDEDFAIVGALLRNAPCTSSRGQQLITAKKHERCVQVNIGKEGTTTICADEQQPSFSIGLPSPASQQPLTLSPVKRQYGLAIFLFLLGIGFLLLWGRVDLQYAVYRSKTSKRFDKLLSGGQEVAIRYIAPPPKYAQKQAGEKTVVRLPPTQQPLLASAGEKKEQPTSQPRPQPSPLSTALNRGLIRFNTLSQELCNLIAAKQFTQAEQQYPQAYRLALELYPQVQEENKKRLMKVVSTLHGQLKELRKAYSVARDVRQQYQLAQRQQQPEQFYQPKVWEPAKILMKKEQVRHLDEELTKLRHLLEQGHHPTAVQQFRKRLWH